MGVTARVACALRGKIVGAHFNAPVKPHAIEPATGAWFARFADAALFACGGETLSRPWSPWLPRGLTEVSPYDRTGDGHSALVCRAGKIVGAHFNAPVKPPRD